MWLIQVTILSEVNDYIFGLVLAFNKKVVCALYIILYFSIGLVSLLFKDIQLVVVNQNKEQKFNNQNWLDILVC